MYKNSFEEMGANAVYWFNEITLENALSFHPKLRLRQKKMHKLR